MNGGFVIHGGFVNGFGGIVNGNGGNVIAGVIVIPMEMK